MSNLINISFDRIIFKLLCLYAFFIPLEKILEIIFGIDTVFKPYRVIAIIILFTFVIKSFYKWHVNKELKTDIFLYVIFVYGAMVTIYRMISTNFHLGYFYNDTFQIVLYLGIFIVIKHSKISLNNIQTIIKSLALGVIVNIIYILFSFFILRRFAHRDTGFMDNPNYLALSLVLLVLLMLNYRSLISGFYKTISWWLLLLSIGYIFIVAGSRSGLAVLILSGLIVFYFSSLKEKLIIVVLCIGMFFFIGFLTGLSYKTVGSLSLLNRINKNSQNDPRFPAWRGAVRSAEATNFVGTGIGQFKARFKEFYYQENNELIRKMIVRGYFLSPHSDYFALLAVYGIVGLLSYLLFLFLTIKNIYIKAYEAINVDEKLYYQYAFLAFMVLILFGITAENFNSALYWIVIGTSSKINFES